MSELQLTTLLAWLILPPQPSCCALERPPLPPHHPHAQAAVARPSESMSPGFSLSALTTVGIKTHVQPTGGASPSPRVTEVSGGLHLEPGPAAPATR